MDIREFSNMLMEATKNMSDEERNGLMNMFQSISKEIKKEEKVTPNVVFNNNGEIPDGMTRASN